MSVTRRKFSIGGLACFFTAAWHAQTVDRKCGPVSIDLCDEDGHVLLDELGAALTEDIPNAQNF